MIFDLDNITAGDTVAVSYGYQGNQFLSDVVRTTSTQVILKSRGNGSDWRFWKKNGRAVGDTGYTGAHITPATPEIKREIALADSRTRLNAMRWDHIPENAVLAVVAILDEQKRKVKL